MDVNFKICGSVRSEIRNKCFVVAMCLENQPRWRRLQTINRLAWNHGHLNCTFWGIQLIINTFFHNLMQDATTSSKFANIKLHQVLTFTVLMKPTGSIRQEHKPPVKSTACVEAVAFLTFYITIIPCTLYSGYLSKANKEQLIVIEGKSR